jgi:CRISPR-associated protein Csh2
MSDASGTIREKSEILFIYDSIYSIPNGDPFTGEQRYDEETKNVLVSDVRIKRFIRDFLLAENEMENGQKHEIYVKSVEAEGEGSSSAARVEQLQEKYDDLEDDGEALLRQCVDVRLFGAVSTATDDLSVNLTGPVQFALLNPSLNRVNLRMHQNTSVFKSDVSKQRGAIGTTSVVPYGVLQVHGWVNPFSARHTGLSDEDLTLMFRALWDSVNNANTRSKSNQSSLLLLQIVYDDPRDKLYRVDDYVDLGPEEGKKEEQLRGPADFAFDFSRLHDAAQDDKVKEVRYHAALDEVKNNLLSGAASEKFTPMEWRS